MKQKETINSIQKKKGVKSLMSRNVTQFRHLLVKSYINQDDLNWTIGLRDNKIPKTIQHKESSAPQVFYKKTAVSSIRDELNAKQGHFIVNAGQYHHMFMNKMEKSPSKQTLHQIKFYTDLRKDDKYDKINSSKSHKQFVNTPFIDRHQFPTFIKKEFIKKPKSIEKMQEQTALDGGFNQPYSTKLRTNNYGFFQPFVRAKGRSKVNLPSLGWQIGLRNY